MTREEAIEYAESKKMRLEALVYNDDCKYGNYAMYSGELSFVNAALTALRPVSRELVERMAGEWVQDINKGPAVFYCSSCGESFEIHSYEFQKYRFCPFCMSPMTDEAEDMMLKRMEEIYK